MFSKVRRFISFAVCLVALGLILASNAAPAQAATTITVGDDGVRCHGSVPTIAAALAALGTNPAGKIVVCAGSYTTTAVVNGANKLTIMGKPGAVIKAPAGFNGVMLTIQNSQKVTVKGLTFDGQGGLAVGASTLGTTAIYVYHSSAVITGNSIVNWHTPGFATSSVYMNAILVQQDAGQSIAITKNTITDFQTRGISVTGQARVTISGNTLTTPDTSTNNPIGIFAGGNTLGGKISGNKVTSDQFPLGTAQQTAIILFEASHFSISSNTVTHWFWGIVVASYGDTTNGAGSNKISGNKVYETAVGIMIQSNAWGTFDAHADGNRITGNKIINTVDAGLAGIAVTGGDPAGGPNCYALNEVIKGNKITNVVQGVVVDTSGGAQITGVFTPNTIN